MATLRGKLRVLPDAERVEEAQVAAAARTPFVDGADFATWMELVERLDGLGFLERRPAPPLTARMLLGACAQRLGTEVFGRYVLEPAFARAALELIFELKQGQLTPEAFAEAVESLPAARLPRARALARLYAAYEARLAELRLGDREDALRGALERLRAEGLPARLRMHRGIALAHFHDFPPLRLALLLELARACEQAGIGFELEVPGAGNAQVDFAVDGVLGVFERLLQETERVEVAKTDLLDTPFGPLGRALFQAEAPRGAAEAVADRLSLWSAATPLDECRHLAREVAAEVDAGTPPEQLAIAFRDLGEQAEQLEEALGELGVPARIRRGAPLASTAVGRVALELPALVEDGFPAERVATLVASRYLPALSIGAPPSAEALFRQASVRDDRIGAQGEKGAYQVRLGQLAERLERRHVRRGRPARLLLERCERLISACARLPAEARASELLQGWRAALSELGLDRAIKAREPRGEEATPLGRAVVRALARDQAAGEALEALVIGLDAALRQSGVGDRRMERRTFHRWLLDAAEDFNLAPRGLRGGAVRVLELRELPGRTFARVRLGGLTDGRLPGRETPHPLFPDEDRRAVNAFVKRAVFRLTTGELDGRLAWRPAEDRLLFYLALQASRGPVTLSCARTGASSQEQQPSQFLEELTRLTGVVLQARPARALPLLDEVRTEAQLRERVALEALARTDVRVSEPDPSGPALRSRFEAEPWFGLAREQVAIEEERLRFFSDPEREAGPHTGQLAGKGVGAPIDALFRAGPDVPFSASALDRFGNCAFQGFLGYALGLQEPDDPGEEQDARGRGTFWHRTLELLFPRLGEAGLLGRPLEEVPDALIDAVVEQAATEAEQSGHVGHPALWRIGRERARAMVRRVLASDHRGLPFDGMEPHGAELPFGEPTSPEGWREVVIPAGAEGEAPIHLRGTIDRVDRGAGGLGLLDYKSSSSAIPGGDELLTTAFQLPIYLYAARASGHAGAMQAAWLNLKDGKPDGLEDKLAGMGALDEVLSPDPEVRARVEEAGGKNLATALHRLVGGLRAGRFPAHPQDCGFCAFRAVCRISQRVLGEEP